MPAVPMNPPPNRLAGDFLECCDCQTICPCWVDETPDEDHCSGIYVWRFDNDSALAGEPLAGLAVAVAAYHGKRGQAQSALYIDARTPPRARQALIDGFTMASIAALQPLKALLGTIVAVHDGATITFEPQGANWQLSITKNQQTISQATVTDATPNVTLRNTALHQEFGLQDEVRVQRVAHFKQSDATLPSGAFEYRGRAGMAGRFHYRLV